MIEPKIVTLPFFYLPLLGGLFLAGWAGASIAIKAALKGQQAAGQEPDWTVPTVDAAASGNSLFHRWDVRFKLVALLGFILLLVSTRSPWSGLIAIVIALGAVLLSRLPLLRVGQRILAISGFLSLFLLLLPLTAVSRPGDTLLVFGQFDWLSFNLRGLQLALAIVGKACAVALLMEPLLATAALPRTIEGLTRLGVPEKVGQMILLSHRYIFVFIEEARRMSVGMQVRGFQRRADLATLQVMGNFLGMLFVRSFERTERVHAAMQARGYQERFPAPSYFRVTAGDWIHAAVWLLLGVALLLFDRLGGV